MIEISKCRSCGYVGPWKECCRAMNLDAPSADEAWAASRRQALAEAVLACEGVDVQSEGDDHFYIGADACQDAIRALANPEE